MNLTQKPFLVVVLILGLTLLMCVGGFIYLASTSTSIPSILETIAASAMTGLVGLLVQRDSTGN